MREAPAPACPRSFDEACPRTRRLGGDPADGPARSPRRDFDRRRRRDLKTSRQGRDGENSLRALASDLAYLEGGSGGDRHPLPWPAPEALALKFVAHHLWDSARRDTDPGHGMPDNIAAVLRAEGLLRADGPHAPRPCAGGCPAGDPASLERRGRSVQITALRSAIRLAVRATARPRTRKSQKAVTADVLERLLATCASDRLVDARDAALLLVAFASGGAAQRSGGTALRVAHEEAPVPADPSDPSPPPCLAFRSGLAAQDHRRRRGRQGVSGWRPVAALREWLSRADIIKGRCSGRSINGAV